jgi:hypothetical protein
VKLDLRVVCSSLRGDADMHNPVDARLGVRGRELPHLRVE